MTDVDEFFAKMNGDEEYRKAVKEVEKEENKLTQWDFWEVTLIPLLLFSLYVLVFLK